MKLYLLFTLFLIGLGCTTSLIAQEEKISYSEESGPLKRERFIDEFDYIFRTQEEMTAWWKLSMFNLTLEYERKLNPEWSVNIGLIPDLTFVAGDFLSGQLDLLFQVESRWYYQMKKRILNGQQANNFSGNYLGLRLAKGFEFDFDNRTTIGESESLIWPSTELTFGLQRRIMRRSFIDFNVGTGFGEVANFQFNSDGQFVRAVNYEWIFNYRVKLGIILGAKIKEQANGAYCEFFKCYQEEKLLFKIDLLNVIRHMDAHQQTGNLYFGLERKLGLSPFTFNLEAFWNYNFINPDYFPERTSSRMAIGLAVEPRYYHDLKRRIAQGLSANNISGSFVGLHVEIAEQQFRSNSGFNSTEQWIQINPMAGIQKRIFDKGYFEFKAGLGVRGTKYLDEPRDRYWDDPRLAIPIDIRIGLAF
ncbi:MAG: hypothetical protein AAFP19_08500 [Bacteroidota bacterium]